MTRLLDTTGPLPAVGLDPEQVLDGTPTTGFRAMATIAGAEVGLWEMTPGTAQDVEADEVFVVLSGSADVTFSDGETIHLSPGAVVRLAAGESTVWHVHETLRKVYVT